MQLYILDSYTHLCAGIVDEQEKRQCVHRVASYRLKAVRNLWLYPHSVETFQARAATSTKTNRYKQVQTSIKTNK